MWLSFFLLFTINVGFSLTSSFDLSGVISGNSMAGVPLGRSLGHGELDVEGICTQPGMACQNCSQAVTCIPLPVGWLKVPLETCSEGLTCNAHLQKCSKQTVPECDIDSIKYQHTCEQVGIFPDAHDCRKFHLCSPPETNPGGRPADHRTALCPRHYGFNPRNAQCSTILSRGQCTEKPVPLCTKLGQNGVLPSSPNHYYVCLSKNGALYPQIFICPNGWYFVSGFCHPELPQRSDLITERVLEDRSEKSVLDVPPTTTPAIKKAKVTTTRMEGFFSTEKATTIKPDTFLADKFDLTNYETTDDEAPFNNDAFTNSFESNEFW